MRAKFWAATALTIGALASVAVALLVMLAYPSPGLGARDLRLITAGCLLGGGASLVTSLLVWGWRDRRRSVVGLLLLSWAVPALVISVGMAASTYASRASGVLLFVITGLMSAATALIGIVCLLSAVVEMITSRRPR